MLRTCGLIFALFVTGLAVCPQAVAQAKPKKAEVQLVCPVFTDRIVGPDSRSLRYRGIQIYFSSDLAARKWMRDPESYLDTGILPQLADLILPERVLPQMYCPVFSKRKIGMKDPSVLYEGQRVYLFDQEAVAIWESAPERFFKPELLPQFPQEPPPAETEAEAAPMN